MTLIPEFNEIDRGIVDLILRRVEMSEQQNADAPLSGEMAVEAERIDQLVGQMELPIDRELIKSVLKHISQLAQQHARPQRVAFLGPMHSYSHLATLAYFGDTQFAPVASIQAVFEAVERGDATKGVVPIENSTDGRIVDTLAMFVRQKMQICGEILLPIHHNLMSKTPRDQIKEVHSKPQALSQCRQWLAKNLPSATLKENSSTTAAAKLAAETPGVAAVASAAAARQYDLDILNANIEDNANNVTRFAVLSRESAPPSGDDKTSLLFAINHAPGALADVMNVFKQHQLNLTWIESFPMPDSPNEYLFFVEIGSHVHTAAVKSAIESISALTQRLDVLGSYPRDRSNDSD